MERAVGAPALNEAEPSPCFDKRGDTPSPERESVRETQASRSRGVRRPSRTTRRRSMATHLGAAVAPTSSSTASSGLGGPKRRSSGGGSVAAGAAQTAATPPPPPRRVALAGSPFDDCPPSTPGSDARAAGAPDRDVSQQLRRASHAAGTALPQPPASPAFDLHAGGAAASPPAPFQPAARASAAAAAPAVSQDQRASLLFDLQEASRKQNPDAICRALAPALRAGVAAGELEGALRVLGALVRRSYVRESETRGLREAFVEARRGSDAQLAALTEAIAGISMRLGVPPVPAAAAASHPPLAPDAPLSAPRMPGELEALSADELRSAIADAKREVAGANARLALLQEEALRRLG